MSAKGPVRIFLSGEGSNELGSYAGHAAYRNDGVQGVIHALIKKIEPDGWEVGGARTWKNIRKYRANPRAAHADTHNVLALAWDAVEAKCEVLAFCRDVDKEPGREAAVEAGITLVPTSFSRAPDVIGGVAKPALEGWILALLGHKGSEQDRHVEKTLVAKGVASKDGEAMVNVVIDADLAGIPADATSLHLWLNRARAVLPERVRQRAVE